MHNVGQQRFPQQSCFPGKDEQIFDSRAHFSDALFDGDQNNVADEDWCFLHCSVRELLFQCHNQRVHTLQAGVASSNQQCSSWKKLVSIIR